MKWTGEEGALTEALEKNRGALAQLAGSGEAKRLMELLEQQGGVQKAAEAAAGGDTGALLGLVDRLMRTEEGAALVDRIGAKAREAGLDRK